MNLRTPTSARNVLLQDVGPRDGLQAESSVLKPAERARIIEALADAGLPRIQIGSFVNPHKVPQMAGTDHVWGLLRKRPGVRYSVLVLSERGLDQAFAAGIPHVEIYVSVSETHSLRNVGTTVAAALDTAERMVQRALKDNMGVTAGVMCAFGCFYEGAVSRQKILEILRRLNLAGEVEIGLADTAGMGHPHGVREVLAAVREVVPIDRITLHLHDTHGRAMDNLTAGLAMGVRRFDASVGGLGGCPFIPGAAGNIATEKTVEVLERAGYSTGVDADKVRRVAAAIEGLLRGGEDEALSTV